MSRLIDADALIKEIAKIEDLRTLSTKVIGEAIDRVPGIEIIHCKDCRKHNQGINEAPYLADRCPLIIHRGYAKGHEFDYQFCCFGERKEQ